MSLAGGYEFSNLFHASVTAYSPGSTFLATGHLRRVIIRSTASLSIVRTFQCLGGHSAASTSRHTDNVTIDHLSWSSDSLYVMAFSSKASTAWIFGLTDEGNGEGGEVARIGGEGPEGLVRVEWGKGGREVLAWSDHGIRLTVWDLATGHGSYIQRPKSTSAHAYSPDARYLAVAERHGTKDHIGIYDSHAGYALLRHFPIVCNDVQSVSWSPCGKYIAVHDNMLGYGAHIYSPLGPLLHSFTPSSHSFSPVSSTEDPGLGVRCATWAPGGRWLALGGWDGRVRVIESEGGRCIANMGWATKTAERDTAIWREPSEWLRDTRGRGIVTFNRTTGSAPLPAVRPDVTRTPPRSGICQLAFDTEATLMLVRLETQPNVVHVHTFLPTPTSSSPEVSHLAALVFTDAVKTARWCSGRRKIAISTRSGAVYFWDGDGGWVEDGDESAELRGGVMEGVGIPTLTDFAATEAIWSPDGFSLCILDKANSQFCVLYDDPAPDASGGGEGSVRWDGVDGLTHVSEEDEEADRSVLSSLAEAESAWMSRGGYSMSDVSA